MCCMVVDEGNWMNHTENCPDAEMIVGENKYEEGMHKDTPEDQNEAADAAAGAPEEGTVDTLMDRNKRSPAEEAGDDSLMNQSRK